MSITPAEIAELRRLYEAATKGPWSASTFQVYGDHRTQIAHTGMGQLPVHRGDEAVANASFIAAAKTAFPALLDALEARVERWRPIETAPKDGETVLAASPPPPPPPEGGR